LSFFDQPGATSVFKPVVRETPDIKEWPEPQLLAFEKELLGIYVTGHPLARYAKQFRRVNSMQIKDLAQCKDEEMVKIVALIVKVKNTITKRKQEKMAILKVEDLSGEVEVLVFPSTYSKVCGCLNAGTVVLLRGRLDTKESLKILAEDMFSIDEIYRLVRAVKVDLIGVRDNVFESLKTLLGKYPGNTPVYLNLTSPAQTHVQVVVGQDLFVSPSDQLVIDIEKLVGDKVSLVL
jgi:DNA polymerase-3 subunit alpha